jgi:hypothetical protein
MFHSIIIAFTTCDLPAILSLLYYSSLKNVVGTTCRIDFMANCVWGWGSHEPSFHVENDDLEQWFPEYTAGL